MTISNVSTYQSLQSLLQNMSSVQSSLNNDQEQLSSGNKSQTFDGISSNIQQLTSLNAQVARLTNYQQDNGNISGQLQATNTALGQITSIGDNVKSLIATQLSGTSSAATFQQEMQSQLASLQSELNTSYAGNYVFGGADITNPPVKSPIPAPIQVGTPDSSYYQGSDQDPTARISDSQVIVPGVRADNQAFQQIIAGIQQAISAAGSSGNTQALSNAENLVGTGIQGVTALQSSVNNNILAVQNTDTQSQSLQTYYQGIVSNISSTDVVSVSTQVAQDTSVLQASFETYARISQLTLSNYLK